MPKSKPRTPDAIGGRFVRAASACPYASPLTRCGRKAAAMAIEMLEDPAVNS